jgi:TetR/AcrR family transcriptional regulator
MVQRLPETGIPQIMPPRKKKAVARRQGRPNSSVAVGKEMVVAATREALRTTPPGEVTFNQISKLAGVDQRLIRYYFGVLPDLLKAVAIEVTEELRGRFAASISHQGSVRDRMRRRVAIFLEFFGHNPHYHRLVVDFLINSKSDDRDAALERFRSSIADLHELLQESWRPGQVSRLDAGLLHVSMAATCEFLFSAKPVFSSLFGEEADTPAFKERFCDFVTDLVLGSLQAK